MLKTRNIILFTLFFFSLAGWGQTCIHKLDSRLTNQFLKEQAKTVQSRNKTTYRIPIVFHILYTRPEENVSDVLLQEQIEVLNEDFNGYTDDGNAHRSIFDGVKGVAKIEFYIEQIIRKPIENKVPSPVFTTTQMDAYKYDAVGSSAIDPNNFLNVWVCEFAPVFGSLGVVGGHAYSPVLDEAERIHAKEVDGVMLDWRTLGRSNRVELQNSIFTVEVLFEGHTLSHEIGHYLGLAHTYGDKLDGSCGDDGLEDTPKTGFEISCTEGENPCPNEILPPMYENFMSASKESCQNMFTQQQVNLMRFVLTNYRCDLIDACLDSDEQEGMTVYPNPVTETLYFRINDFSTVQAVEMRDLNGQLLLHEDMVTDHIHTGNLKSGIYILTMHTDQGVLRKRILKN